MKASLLVGLLLVGACASSGTQSGDVGNPGGGDVNANVQHVELNGGQAFPGSADLGASAESRTPATWHPMNATPERTWQYLPIAYSKLGLAITRYDSASHIIEGQRLRSRADFGGKQLSDMMNCGDVAGMPSVTRFDINIQVRSGVKGSGNSSSVASVVTATARPGGVAGNEVPCTVNPLAADRVAAAVAEALAATK
jgi:hypothetical protein